MAKRTKKTSRTKAGRTKTGRSKTRTKPRAAKKPKAAARKKRATKKKTSARASAGTAARRRTRRSARTRRPGRRAASAPPRAVAAVVVEAEILTGAGGPLAAHVAAALQSAGYDPPEPEIVDTIASVGAGYRKGPAPDPPFGIPIDVDAEVARELVQRFVDGDRSPLIERQTRRMNVRSAVDSNLDQLGGEAGETARTTLTSLALGTWDPEGDEVAKLYAIPGFMVRWYVDGGKPS